jgi:hypothetical protein
VVQDYLSFLFFFFSGGLHSANRSGGGGGGDIILPLLRGITFSCPIPFFLPQPFQGSSSGDNNLLFACGILKVLLAGGAANGCGGPDFDTGSSPVTGNTSRGRVFLGEHWGGIDAEEQWGRTGLGEHWGPSRQRYLQGPWFPHPEELDRCEVSLCVSFYP